MKNLFLFLFFLPCHLFLTAQVTVIQGIYADKKGNPISGAQVFYLAGGGQAADSTLYRFAG